MCLKILFISLLVTPLVFSMNIKSTGTNVDASSDIQGKIVGGDLARLGDFPYQALIALRIGDVTLSVFGGALISYNWILTAASPLTNLYEFLVISLGVVSLSDQPQFSTTIQRDSESIRIHPRFNRDFLQFNLAMINLPDAQPNILNSPYLGTVQLPSPTDTFVGQVGVIAGFGTTVDLGSVHSQNLYYVEQEITINRPCFDTFGFFVTDGTLCTNTTNGRAPCDGDFGGGLVIKDTNVLAGILSFVSATSCRTGVPAVYVRVGGYLDWINGVIYNNWTDPTTTTTATTTTSTQSQTTTTDGASLISIQKFLIMFFAFVFLYLNF